MNDKAIFAYLKQIGCCNGCCLRYLGVKNPDAYEKCDEYAAKYQDVAQPNDDEKAACSSTNNTEDTEKVQEIKDPEATLKRSTNGLDSDHLNGSPECKKRRWAVCVSCLGVLQPQTWGECFQQIRDVLEKKRYECPTFACALSAPIATLLREKAITLLLVDKFPEYNTNIIPALKEAWKWSFGARLSGEINKTQDSGAISPLLITFNMEYPDDADELEPLKRISPALFRERSRQRRFAVEFTRRSVEQALEDATLESLRKEWPDTLPCARAPVTCVSVTCAHAPLYLAGRYIKLSRSLPQTPWVLDGKRMMESSVQEIIFGPIAKLYELSAEDIEHRLKFVSAGREDVDVRCLGQGRPFAVEVSDPRREPDERELEALCDAVSSDGRVRVNQLVSVTRDDLTKLKQGEETKCKTYEALCIKLTHSEREKADEATNGDAPITVTPADIANINSYTNVPAEEAASCRVRLQQRTPARVLHRRPLRTRTRDILALDAAAVPGHPQLFTVRVRTAAGTYVKEWASCALGRTRPRLADAVRARTDILALDVTNVELEWPPVK